MTSRDSNSHRTRLAPSPTGALHLGNARTFLINWALARQRDWEIVLRVDDLDGPRIKPGADQEAIDMLAWLGCDWDVGPFYQTRRRDHYDSALATLVENGLAYPCRCTRSQIQTAQQSSAQSAPHASDHELRYPGTCRPTNPVRADKNLLGNAELTWRLRVADETHVYVDQFAGATNCNVQRQVGDFAVATKGGVPSYQLAVVVDDQDQAITEIVRGDDLISSVARQDAVREALGITSRPGHWHLPLVIGTDGRRLAKRHGDSRLSHYRQLGVSPARIIGLIAEWSGCGPRCEMTADAFRKRFRIEQLSKKPIVFTSADDRWLRGLV